MFGLCGLYIIHVSNEEQKTQHFICLFFYEVVLFAFVIIQNYNLKIALHFLIYGLRIPYFFIIMSFCSNSWHLEIATIIKKKQNPMNSFYRHNLENWAKVTLCLNLSVSLIKAMQFGTFSLSTRKQLVLNEVIAVNAHGKHRM